jgi:hypothetical protein
MKMNTTAHRAAGKTVDAALNPRISIQIVPLDFGPYRAMRHPFELIELEDEEDPYMMYLEASDSDQVVRSEYDEIGKYIERFDTLKQQILDATETNEHLGSIIRLLLEGRNCSPSPV